MLTETHVAAEARYRNERLRGLSSPRHHRYKPPRRRSLRLPRHRRLPAMVS